MSDMSPVQICTNLLPGQCCQAIAAPIMNYFNPSYPSVVAFTNLSPLHIAAIWARRGNIRACSGVPIATRPGPGNWRHQATGDERAVGASYITLPTALPPGETEANWLSAEGVLGFVWGGGRWFVKGAESLGERNTKKLKRRGMVRAEHGTVYAREPKRWKRPDVLVVNGTRYVDAGTVDLKLERSTRIANLPPAYHGPLSAYDRELLKTPIEHLVQDVHKGIVKPIDILRSYGKVAIKAHAKTNCLTEVMISPGAESWIEQVNLNGPLAGIPVSLKDSIAVQGFDVSVGYSRNTGKPFAEDGAIVKILKDAGAVPYVKTNLPISLLSFESANDVWGRSTNPHNDKYSPGGSTGGESALLAYGGGRIGIGSDVAGSVRVPAHFAGIYSLRCSTGRWPKMGTKTSMPGQEGIPSVFSPMARTLPDLVYFTRSMIGMKPWEYDHSVHPLPWQSDVYDQTKDQKTLRIGVMRSDGVVPPSPACLRALSTATSALSTAGHTVIDLFPPSPARALILASSLLNADGCRTFLSYFRTGEWNDPGAAQMALYASLPRPIKYLHYLYTKYIKRDPFWAELLYNFRARSAHEQWELVAQREAYKAEWHAWWRDEAKIDVLLCPPNATPAVPHGGMKDAVASCGYTFLFNLLDYTAGVIPVTHVDRELDGILPVGFATKGMNGVARGAYKHYDAGKMHGLPVGVQIVGQRLQEEKVLAVMERVVEILEHEGKGYGLLDIE
ncbi:MAG: hypothetical protein Q9197_006773 [Variospora fuerteventurae]